MIRYCDNLVVYTILLLLLFVRYCDNVWTCLLQDVEVKETQASDIVHVDKVKIVACDAGSGTSTSGGSNKSKAAAH